jgi:hypothetical protein
MRLEKREVQYAKSGVARCPAWDSAARSAHTVSLTAPPAPPLFQEHCPPNLLRVPLESRHHRQCPLLAERVHAGTTLSILPMEGEDLIRVSLGEQFVADPLAGQS